MKKIFTKVRLILLGKVVVAVVGVAMTFFIIARSGYLPGGTQIIPGFLFGMVVLIWKYSGSFKDMLNWRSAVFLVASGGIYLAVYLLIFITTINWMLDPGDAPVAMLVSAILICSIPLPTAHGLLLGAAWKRSLMAIPILICMIIVISLIGWVAISVWGFEMNIPLALSVTAWQLAYLVSMFGFRKGKQEKRLEPGVVEVGLAG